MSHDDNNELGMQVDDGHGMKRTREQPEILGRLAKRQKLGHGTRRVGVATERLAVPRTLDPETTFLASPRKPQSLAPPGATHLSIAPGPAQVYVWQRRAYLASVSDCVEITGRGKSLHSAPSAADLPLAGVQAVAAADTDVDELLDGWTIASDAPLPASYVEANRMLIGRAIAALEPLRYSRTFSEQLQQASASAAPDKLTRMWRQHVPEDNAVDFVQRAHAESTPRWSSIHGRSMAAPLEANVSWKRPRIAEDGEDEPGSRKRLRSGAGRASNRWTKKGGQRPIVGLWKGEKGWRGIMGSSCE